MKSLTRQSYVIPRPPVGLGENDAPALAPGDARECDGADPQEGRLLALQIQADEAFAMSNKGRTVALIEQIYDLLDVMEGRPVSLPV